MTTEHITIGKYILDNLTTGMYNDPLCVYREYIQNSADAINKAAYEEKKKVLKDYEIRITLGPADGVKRIVVEDNGCGCHVATAKKTLLSLGDSQKTSDRDLGFRGIGRLGGIAYCDSLIFTTKAKGETEETCVEWDCKKIQKMLDRNNTSSRGLEAKELIAECVAVSTSSSKRKINESFFRVEMRNVRSAKGEIFDVTQVRSYIEQTAPVPFDVMQLHFGDELDDWLRKEISDYNTYRIYVNDVLLNKKYSQTLPIHNNQTDMLEGYEKFNIEDRHGKVIARGWFGKRKDNLGAILKSSGVSSLRVRVGNILIGDETLLDSCFTLNRGTSNIRFNGYLVGEIHIVSRQLVPNGRRDDFQDSEMKSDFFHGVAKIVDGLASQIGKDSREKNEIRKMEKAKQTITKVDKQLDKGFVDAAKKETIATLKEVKEELSDLQGKRNISTETKQEADTLLEKIDNQIDSVKTTDRTLAQSLEGYNRNEKKLIDEILDSVYKSFEGSTTAQQLVDRVIAKLKRNR